MTTTVMKGKHAVSINGQVNPCTFSRKREFQLWVTSCAVSSTRSMIVEGGGATSTLNRYDSSLFVFISADQETDT
jgi:hypothetical protein